MVLLGLLAGPASDWSRMGRGSPKCAINPWRSAVAPLGREQIFAILIGQYRGSIRGQIGEQTTLPGPAKVPGGVFCRMCRTVNSSAQCERGTVMGRDQSKVDPRSRFVLDSIEGMKLIHQDGTEELVSEMQLPEETELEQGGESAKEGGRADDE